MASTKGMAQNVPLLLRHLKNNWSDQTSQSDRFALRESFRNMKVDHFGDVEEFLTAFDQVATTMAEYGMKYTDEDLLYQLNEGLGAGWKTHKDLNIAIGNSYAAARKNYLLQAKIDATLPGTLKIVNVSDAQSVHTTGFSSEPSEPENPEICRNHSQGKCRLGHRCKYQHVVEPNAPNASSSHNHSHARDRSGGDSRPSRSDSGRRKCDYCGANGHSAATCFKKKYDDKRDRQGAEPSHSATEVIVVDGLSYSCEEVVGLDSVWLAERSMQALKCQESHLQDW